MTRGPGRSRTFYRLDPLLVEKIEVDPETDCWIWLGASQKAADRTRAGRYGRISRRGKLWLIHRWTYQLLVGRIPEDHQVHHICEVTLCCNPAHLEAQNGLSHILHHNERARREAEAA